jgi:Kef-type K+ transport system membrane component KefB
MKLSAGHTQRHRGVVMFGVVIYLLCAFLIEAVFPSNARPSPAPLTTASQNVATATTAAPAPATSAPNTSGAQRQAGLVEEVLIALILILLAAKIGGDLFERLGQPAVLGELIVGMVIGNITLLPLGGFASAISSIVHDPEVDTFVTLLAEVGVVILLFQVGLESTVREMVSVGLSSLLVATLGVVGPVVLGFVVGELFLPQEPWTVHLFLGTLLAATSVGITARVLADLGKTSLRESKIILGAAVIDDVLGLITLAAVQGIIAAANTGTPVSVAAIAWIVGKALLFFLGAIVLGLFVSRRFYRLASLLRGKGILITATLIWCFGLAYIASKMGLAPIVGAFAAGLVLEEATFVDWEGREEQLESLLRPVGDFLIPVFFVHMGMRVQLTVFGQVSVLGLAAALTVAAIIGKQLCSLGILERGVDRLVVGIGMIPRGEVGLIVASIGAGMRTVQGHPVISPSVFSASVIMVVVTTMLTPPVLKWSLDRMERKRASVAGESSRDSL